MAIEILNPAMALATSLVAVMLTILFMILCVIRRKSVEVTNVDEETAFDEYRKQQQASSLEDLVAGINGQAGDRKSSVVLTSIEELELNNTRASHRGGDSLLSSGGAVSSRISHLPGADLIDQFPDTQHVYRLEPTENLVVSSASSSGETRKPMNGASSTMQVEDHNKNAIPQLQVEYVNLGNVPNASIKNDVDTAAEYAKVDKNMKKNAQRPKTTHEESEMMDSEQYIPLWTTSKTENKEFRRSLSPGVSDDPKFSHSLSVSGRHLSSKSVSSYASDFQDCTEFKRPEPAK